ncbi:hypothetical protein BpHYR1_052354 [Brachionus plicatilis]|uniref:Uncharacterized protein n=1 Tax=Brachionus plicatilis TaxID=10195 RepID=A0A3M7S9E8_BRAPC|nr:hypothetical protein BpHYR1_052354 [Brachionus plicatilis]
MSLNNVISSMKLKNTTKFNIKLSGSLYEIKRKLNKLNQARKNKLQFFKNYYEIENYYKKFLNDKKIYS